MTNSFNKKQIGLAVACALALGILSGAAQAQNQNPNPDGKALLQDTRTAPVKSGFGLCWHTGFGPPPAAGPECDPNYVAPAKPMAAVAPAAPVAPPVQVAALPPPVPKMMPMAEKLTLDADTLFDFDKATLRPAGRDTLDSFVGKPCSWTRSSCAHSNSATMSLD